LLLNDLSNRLPTDALVLHLCLVGLKDIAPGSSYNGLSDPYVEIKMMPNDPVAGSQQQASEVKPQTLNPKWMPAERFQFVLSKPNDARILISVYHFNQSDPKKSTPLGDGILKVKDIPSGNKLPHPFMVKLRSPETGKAVGEADVTVQLFTVDEASAFQEHIVYEFQRWQPIIEWGSTPTPGHLLPTDPGRWCSSDGSKFAKELEEAAPAIPVGWSVTDCWHVVCTDTDPEGWEYSSLFESPFWHDKNDHASYVVRRRKWFRLIRKGDHTVDNPISGRSSSMTSTSSSVGGSSRRKRMFSNEKKK
jgi:hypothetical protein